MWLNLLQTKSVDPYGEYPNGLLDTFDLDNGIEGAGYMQLVLDKRAGADIMWASELVVTACVTPKGISQIFRKASFYIHG